MFLGPRALGQFFQLFFFLFWLGPRILKGLNPVFFFFLFGFKLGGKPKLKPPFEKKKNKGALFGAKGGAFSFLWVFNFFFSKDFFGTVLVFHPKQKKTLKGKTPRKPSKYFFFFSPPF